MFKNTKAFSGFSVDDSEKAKEFYGKTLGMDINSIEGMEEFGVMELHTAEGEQNILIYPKGKEHQPATFTILNFPVDDIEATVDELKEKGIELLDLGNPEMPQDEKGIFRLEKPKIAQVWFKDSSGNVLSAMQDQ